MMRHTHTHDKQHTHTHDKHPQFAAHTELPIELREIHRSGVPIPTGWVRKWKCKELRTLPKGTWLAQSKEHGES